MKKRKWVTLLLAAAMVFNLAACSSGDQTTADTTENENTSSETGEEGGADTASEDTVYDIKVSGHPYLHAMASQYAIDQGYFNCEDPVVDMYSSGPVQNEAIASGAWDVGTTGSGGIALGAVGYNLKAIAYTIPDENTVDLWVRADSEIAQLEPDENGIYGTADDWRGKTILCNTGSSCHMMLLGLLDYLGLNESDINLIDTSVADSYAAFKAGTGDAVALWSPFGFQAEEETDWVKVASAVDLGLNMPCVVVATEDVIENNWDGVYAYLKAYIQAGNDLMADPEMAAQMLYDFEEEQGINMSESAAAKDIENRPFRTVDEQIELFTVRDDGGCEANDILMQFAEYLAGQGKITEEDMARLQEEGMVDTSFMEAYMEEMAAN